MNTWYWQHSWIFSSSGMYFYVWCILVVKIHLENWSIINYWNYHTVPTVLQCYFGHNSSNGICAFLNSLLQSIDHFVCPGSKSVWWIVIPRSRKIQISSSKLSWLLLDISFSISILNCFKFVTSSRKELRILIEITLKLLICAEFASLKYLVSQSLNKFFFHSVRSF